MNDVGPNQLLRAFQAGDETAFELVFKQYYKPLRVQAFLILNNEEEAEDQVQQLFLDVWNRKLYKNIQEVKAYLHTAIRNRCLNQVTKASHQNKVLLEYAETLSLSVTYDEKEPRLQPGFQAALNELPTQRFRAFQLVYIEDKKYMQAAQEMGISINSLKSHLKLAVKYLKLQVKNDQVSPL